MLNDEQYCINIRNSLLSRAKAVRVDSNGNLLNLSVLSEGYYREVLNILLGCNLVNTNTELQNAPGIDLIDRGKRIAAQVSVTCDPKHIRKKIKHSIEGFDVPKNETWQFYFIPITDDAPKLGKDFEIPEGLLFDKQKDVLDIKRIMQLVRDAGIDIQEALSRLVRKYDKSENDHRELRQRLDDLLLATWKSHRSYKLMQTDEIDRRLFPNIKDSHKFEALGKRNENDPASPVWSIIRESWNEAENHSVVIQGDGGIGKTVSLFSLTNMDKDTVPAPAVYVPMFELVNQDGKVINLSDYFMSSDTIGSLSDDLRKNLCNFAGQPWKHGPSLLVLLDGFNEVPGAYRWNVLQMLSAWHMANPGAQFIAVSRPMDNLSLENIFEKETLFISLSTLTRESVEFYLTSLKEKGVSLPEPEAPIWETIVYPLFLNLFTRTDKLSKQQVWKNYPVNVREAVGPGSLIWNYLQRELLRHEDEQWILRCAVACEYLAPILAHHMIQHYDYTISQRDAIAVIQKAVSEMNLDRMPTHVAKLFSWWEMQKLSLEPPTFLKKLNWADIVLRESGLFVPFREFHAQKAENNQEQRFEFLHQSFRDCLAGLYLIYQAEMASGTKFPATWGQNQSHLALNYAAELTDSDVYGKLWEINRKAQASGNGKNHTATCNLLEMWKRNKALSKELDFSGMDLRELSLTHFLEKDSEELPLFRKSYLSKDTIIDRSVFESEGHSETVAVLNVLPDGRVVSGASAPYGIDHALLVWDVTTGQCLQTLKGHTNSVFCLAVLQDGRLISGSADNTLRVWDIATGQCLQILEGHNSFVSCVAVLPDGRVISGSGDHTLRVWDASTGQCLQTIEGHTNCVACVVVLPSGLVVSGSWDNTLRVWDISTGQCLQTLEGHTDWVKYLVVLPDGRVVSGSKDNTLRVWDVLTSQCLQTLNGHEDKITCVAVLGDGRVVSGSWDNTLRVWDATTGQCLQTLNGHKDIVTCVAVFWDGRVVSGSWDGTLRAWNAATGQCLQILEKHCRSFYCVEILPDGRVISGSDEPALQVWDANAGQCLQTLKRNKDGVTCVDVLQDGHVVIGSEDNTLRVWDVVSGQILQILKGHNGRVNCVIALPNRHVISGSSDNTLRVWDTATGQCLQTMEGHTRLVDCLAVLPDGHVVSGSYDNTLRVWDISTGQCLQILEGHTDWVDCLAVLPDGRVVSGSKDNTLRVWDISTGQCLQILEGHTDWVDCLAVLPDGRVVSGSYDHTLRVWDVSTGQCLQILNGHKSNIACVDVLPDGRVVSGSVDTTLRVWNAATGQCQSFVNLNHAISLVTVLPDERVIIGSRDNSLLVWDTAICCCLQTLEGHCNSVSCVAVISDGRVVSGSYDGTMRLWDPDTGACLDVLEAMEIRVARQAIFRMDFSEAILTEDLARLLWHNGAKISKNDYEKQVKPFRKAYKHKSDEQASE